jgi:hypothetical protein
MVGKIINFLRCISVLQSVSGVDQLVTIRALFVISAVEDLEMGQMDVVVAFLASELDEYIYMEQPEGFELCGEDGQVQSFARTGYFASTCSCSPVFEPHHPNQELELFFSPLFR